VFDSVENSSKKQRTTRIHIENSKKEDIKSFNISTHKYKSPRRIIRRKLA
jgi:hypothetical protein